MKIDYHSHILPRMDDGAENVEVSMELVNELAAQGIVKVYATPHYFSHKETVKDFLIRRAVAYQELMSKSPEIKVGLGAEVRIEYGLSSEKMLGGLCYENTRRILLELPNSDFQEWTVEEIEKIIHRHELIPVIAHIDRYLNIFQEEEIQKILELSGVIFQVNVHSLRRSKVRRWVKKCMQEKYSIILGSDCHNLTSRKPDLWWAKYL